MKITENIISAIELVYLKVYEGDYSRKQARTEVKKMLGDINVYSPKSKAKGFRHERAPRYKPKSAFSPKQSLRDSQSK